MNKQQRKELDKKNIEKLLILELFNKLKELFINYPEKQIEVFGGGNSKLSIGDTFMISETIILKAAKFAHEHGMNFYVKPDSKNMVKIILYFEEDKVC